MFYSANKAGVVSAVTPVSVRLLTVSCRCLFAAVRWTVAVDQLLLEPATPTAAHSPSVCSLRAPRLSFAFFLSASEQEERTRGGERRGRSEEGEKRRRGGGGEEGKTGGECRQESADSSETHSHAPTRTCKGWNAGEALLHRPTHLSLCPHPACLSHLHI